MWAEKCWDDGLDLRRDQLGRGRRTAANLKVEVLREDVAISKQPGRLQD